jgi:hypothetical protein
MGVGRHPESVTGCRRESSTQRSDAHGNALAAILSGEMVIVPTCTAIQAEAVAALNEFGISLNT